MRQIKRFTLIELLVVIAILNILFSILLHSLKNVRDKADGAVCQNNQKQVGLGIIMWSDDNDNYLPHAHCDHRDGTGNLYDLGYMPGTIWRNVLDDSLGVKGNSLATRHCPTVDFSDTGKDFSHFSFTPATYDSNVRLSSLQESSSFLIITDGTARIMASEDNISQEAGFGLDQLKNNDVLFFGDPDRLDGASFVPTTGQGTFEFRHANKSNILFADGHVNLYEQKQIIRRMFRISF